MKLPFSFLPWGKDKEDLYLGIFLKESEGIIFYLQPGDDGLHVTETERFQYTNGWENLIDDTDDVLYRLEAKTKKAPSKTILFLHSHFIDLHAREIRQPYLSKIKEMAKSLELKPLGYIECHEAVLDYLQKKEQRQLTATLLEFDKQTVGIFVYQGGKLIHQENTARTANIIEDLTPVFEKIKEKTILPPRIIMYNSKDLDREVGVLIGHTWSEEFFVQAPSIEIVQESDVINSLVTLFSQQINIGPVPAVMVSEPSKATDDVEHMDEVEDFDEEIEHTLQHEERMGFVIGADMNEIQQADPAYKIEASTRPSFNLAFLKPLVDNIRMLPEIMKKAPIFQSRSTAFSWLLIIGIVLIVCGFIAAEYFFHTAAVTVMLPSQSLTQLLQITNDELKLQTGSETASFTASKATTGTREVGERAKGSVTIYNSSLSSSKTFPKTTVIKATGGQEFTLESDVKVASASGDASAITSSTTKASATARTIGPESNLAAGTKFSVADELPSAVIAKNDAAFSGGTKREIQMVSKNDTASLQKSISTQVSAFAKNTISKKIEKGNILLDQLTSSKNTSTNYSAEEGEEADSVSLKAAVAIAYYYYKDQDLKHIIMKQLEKKVRKGYSLHDANVAYTVRSVKKENGDFVITLEARVKAVPPVTDEQVRSQIAGKSTSELENITRNKFQATGIEFLVKHPIEYFRGWLPFLKRNIRITITYP